MEIEEFRERLSQAEFLLVGLGEEFDAACELKDVQEFQRGRELLQNAEVHWLLPAWSEYCSSRLGRDIRPVLEKLAGMLAGRNYFVVSVSVNSVIAAVFGGSNRLVMPCGSVQMKQCARACEGEIISASDRDVSVLETLFRKLWTGSFSPEEARGLGNCRQCGSPMVFNNVYAENYDETGYLEDWQCYTKWLQGTVNHKLLLLELGVSMGFPSVIRVPFEKIVTYNQKAFLCRVNEKIWQIPADFLSKGVGISKNAIDWLGEL
ncbi:MAG: hypothetical protein J1E01_09025 [Acetatifactor sp.]|nr:hypothetical protein [Acetatifactor sp.]